MSTPFESELHKSPETLESEIDEKAPVSAILSIH
jgi:hypothetical protein